MTVSDYLLVLSLLFVRIHGKLYGIAKTSPLSFVEVDETNCKVTNKTWATFPDVMAPGSVMKICRDFENNMFYLPTYYKTTKEERIQIVKISIDSQKVVQTWTIPRFSTDFPMPGMDCDLSRNLLFFGFSGYTADIKPWIAFAQFDLETEKFSILQNWTNKFDETYGAQIGITYSPIHNALLSPIVKYAENYTETKWYMLYWDLMSNSDEMLPSKNWTGRDMFVAQSAKQKTPTMYGAFYEHSWETNNPIWSTKVVVDPVKKTVSFVKLHSIHKVLLMTLSATIDGNDWVFFQNQGGGNVPQTYIVRVDLDTHDQTVSNCSWAPPFTPGPPEGIIGL